MFSDVMLSNVNESVKESCDKDETSIVSDDENNLTQPYILGMRH